MLTRLRIRDFAIIDDLSVELAPGFNVLSGETGAGKSIVVGALGLLLGDRGRSDTVRTGSERAIVEGIFTRPVSNDLAAILGAQGIDSGNDEIVLRREVQSEGRGRAWINGYSVSIASLAAVGRALTAIHGQHEAQTLLDSDSQREMLDVFGNTGPQAGIAEDLFELLRESEAELAHLGGTRARAGARANELRSVVAELEPADLRAGEEENLDAEASRLEHAVELQELAGESLSVLSDEDSGAVQRVARAQRTLDSIARLDTNAAPLQLSAENLRIVLAELQRDLESYASRIDVDPLRLAEVNERRSELFRLRRKYGGDVAELISTLHDARKEVAVLEGADHDEAAVAARVAELRASFREACEKLSQLRRAAAVAFEERVNRILPALGMEGATLHVDVSAVPEAGATGADRVTLLATLNIGHDRRELSRIASGGELSRVMLAIKSVLAELDGVPTLVFDEVDAGIGGQIALQVGNALRELASHHQILVITHLPQIAARAHRQFIVRKQERDGVARADITAADGADRVAEIARMLAGDPESRTGKKHALELLEALNTSPVGAARQ
jgi:DNA repair protein RecN (Recombination protein N)